MPEVDEGSPDDHDVGRSIGLLLTRREVNATVTLTHTGTTDLPELVRRADVVVAAADRGVGGSPVSAMNFSSL